MVVLTVAKKVLRFEMTIAEWIGTAAILAVPYLLVGMVWTAIGGDYAGDHGMGHAGDHLGGGGYSRVLSILGSIVTWPVLLVSTVCMT
jgi:hypothetical protein